eukprot:scaffold11766_cov154-Skeletonema_marinoi.AAC.2
MSTTNKTISIAVPESKEEEEDIAVLIYQDSQRMRRKSEAAAIAAIKKNSDAARRTSSQTASDASTASCNPTLTSTIGKRDATAKRKRHPSSEEDIEVCASGIRSNYAALKGVQAPPTREEYCVCGMEERRIDAASRNAQINLKLEVCAPGTGQRGSSNYAVLKDVQIKSSKEECA